MAYRGDRERARAAEAPKAGLIADLTRQFADPYAFLRELVQNGIDAGATAIEVRIDAEGERLAFSVSDDGAGMTRAILEGPLLTVFSTSKDGDSTKIGKYGVGFVSVLAIEPEEVIVETWRGGEAWIVRLWIDHRYEIETAAPRAGSGTTVTLRKRVDPAEVGDHVARCRRATLRWCRHASVPIHLTAPEAGAAGATQRDRIDRPIGVKAVVSIAAGEAGEAGEVVVIGPSAGFVAEPDADADDPELAASFVGFYNRGLTLHEATEAPTRGLVGLRVKIASRTIAHTLSRDDVRRDEAYARVVARAEALVPRLREALEEALGQAAEDVARGRDGRAFAGLLEAALATPLRLGAGEIVLPLTDRVDGLIAMPLVEITARLDEVGPAILCAAEPSRITGALARAGRPVVRADHPGIAAGILGIAAIAPDRLYAIADELAASAADDALCAATRRALASAGVQVSRVAVGAFEGAALAGAAVSVATRGGPALLRVAAASRWWRRFGTIDRLLLVPTSPVVAAARARAAEDAVVAGHLLARALLVAERGAIDEGDNDRLIEAASKAIAGSDGEDRA